MTYWFEGDWWERKREREREEEERERETCGFLSYICIACVCENVHPVKSVYCWGQRCETVWGQCVTRTCRGTVTFLPNRFSWPSVLLVNCFPAICARNVRWLYFSNPFTKCIFTLILSSENIDILSTYLYDIKDMFKHATSLFKLRIV